MPSRRNHNNGTMSFDSSQQHSSECLTKLSSRQDTAEGGVFNLVSLESLLAMGFEDGGNSNNNKSACCSLSPNKSWSSLSGSSEDPTVAITDCSSRTSLQDLDLSFEESEFKDPLPSPEPGYWRLLNESEEWKKNRHPFLPSVLTRSPRAVSFSGVEEVHVYDEDADEGIRLPKTPAIQWYGSSSSQLRQPTYQHQLPLLSSTSATRKPPLAPKLQPRRSALKKSETTKVRSSSTTPPLQFPRLEQPASPKVTYYSSRK